MKKVLITGGAGYIGSELVRILLDEGYNIVVLDLFIYGSESLSDLTKKITLIKGDVRDEDVVRKAMTDVDKVVHLAELVGDPVCATCPRLAESINFDGACQVARMAKEEGVKKFVYMSSCSVYGLSNGDTILTEESPLNPVSLYAELKIRVEKYLESITDADFRPTILRLATVYGLSHRPRFDLVVNVLTARGVVEKEFIITSGDAWRPFVYVADVAYVISAILSASDEKVGGNIFNVGHESQNHTISEIGGIVKSVIPDINVVYFTEEEGDKRSYKVNFERLRGAIGFVPSQDVKGAVVELKNYIVQNPDYTHERYSNVETLKKYSCSL